MKKLKLKKGILVSFVLVLPIIALILIIFNSGKMLKCVLTPDKYTFKLNDTIILKFKKDKLKYKKETIIMDYTESDISDDIFLSYFDKFKNNKSEYEKEGWSYIVKSNKRKITLKIVGYDDIDEIKNDLNDYDYYKKYYEDLNYVCK